jgi:hypothetical protein
VRRFAFLLARDIGAHNVNAMLASMSSTELAEWGAFYQIEAEDEKRAYLQARADAKLGKG